MQERGVVLPPFWRKMLVLRVSACLSVCLRVHFVQLLLSVPFSVFCCICGPVPESGVLAYYLPKAMVWVFNHGVVVVYFALDREVLWAGAAG